MNAVEYRALSKQYNILAKDALLLKDRDQMYYLLTEIQNIKSMLIKDYNRIFDMWKKYQIPENIIEVWMIERANSSLRKTEIMLEEMYFNRSSIIEAEISQDWTEED